jgi:hypothetical protein
VTPRGRLQRLNDIRQIADSLRESGADAGAPDLTGSILDRVDAERPFLSGRTRRMVIAGRYGIGAAVLVMVLGVAVAHRMYPDIGSFDRKSSPLSSVVESVRHEAVEQIAGIRQTVPGASSALMTLVVANSPAPAQPQSVTCTMVGPTMTPVEAARQAAPSPGQVFCIDRPLSGFGPILSGYAAMPRSSWRLQPAPLGEEFSPLFGEDQTERAAAPR